MEPGIAKLGHVELVTPNIEVSTHFFKNIVGLTEVERADGQVFLRGDRDQEHHTLTLAEGDEATVDHIAWRTEAPKDVDLFAEELESRGVEIRQLEEGAERGQGEAIRFRIPSGQPFELYYAMEKTAPEASERSRLRNTTTRSEGAVSPKRIDHATMTAQNPRITQRWLQKQLGFQLNEYVVANDGSYNGAWMSVTPTDHDVAFTRDAGGKTGQFHHVAYYFDTVHEIIKAAEILYENEVPIDGGPGKHNVAQSNFLYVRDPGSGHRIELYTGGYLVLDPDWVPVEWTEDDRNEIGGRKGMEIYGLPPGKQTTDS